MADEPAVIELSAYRSALLALAFLRGTYFRREPSGLSGLSVEMNEAGGGRLVIWLEEDDELLRRAVPRSVDGLVVQVRLGTCPHSRLKLTSEGSP